MELTLIRHTFTTQSTIGDLLDGDTEICKILEDTDRGLRSTDSLDYINSKKVHAQTAIPYGRYEVIINFSNRFQRQMPLLLKVPGWEGVRIHTGNKAEDSEGCLITGKQAGKDVVSLSKVAYELLFAKISDASLHGKVYITIEKTKKL